MAEIPLTQGKVALVDDADYEELAKYKWHFAAKGYACRRKDGVIVYMHREITKAEKGFYVDHINHDTLDNRKSNLRCCSQSLNMANASLRADSKSGYKGVSWHTQKNKWTARIHVNGKGLHLGLFDSAHDAARMYNFWALDIFGEHALLNKIKETV